MDVEQADVPLASLDAAHISAMQSANMSQVLLRQTRPLPERAQGQAERSEFTD